MEPLRGPQAADAWERFAARIAADTQARLTEAFDALPDNVAPWRRWLSDKLMDWADRIYR